MSTIQVSLPDDVLAQARKLAERENQPLDELLARALAEHVALLKSFERIRARGQRGSREKFLAALGQVPDIEPDPSDRID